MTKKRTIAEMEILEEVYKHNSFYTDHISFTILSGRCIRVTFSQKMRELDSFKSLVSVTMTIEDLLDMQNMMGTLVDTLKQHGIITTPEAEQEKGKEEPDA